MRPDVAARPIVIIEDSDEDYEVTVWALRQAGVANPICRCSRTAEVKALWTERPDWPGVLSAQYPLLVLLDLNIPGMNWRDTLFKFRSDRWWQSVPVVVLSTSVQPSTVAACYGLGVGGYLRKPLDLDEFALSIRRVADYWLNTVVPPAVPEAQCLLELAALKGI